MANPINRQFLKIKKLFYRTGDLIQVDEDMPDGDFEIGLYTSNGLLSGNATKVSE